jgi:general stress protein YciG
MESEKQREISRKGGQASHRNRDRQQSSGHKNEGTDRKED